MRIGIVVKRGAQSILKWIRKHPKETIVSVTVGALVGDDIHQRKKRKEEFKEHAQFQQETSKVIRKQQGTIQAIKSEQESCEELKNENDKLRYALNHFLDDKSQEEQDEESNE